MSSSLLIEQYSEKAIVVRGNTIQYKDKLLELGGKWNSNLKGGGGWIFPNSKKKNIEELESKITSGEVKPVEVSQSSSRDTTNRESNYDTLNRQFVPLKDYLSLLSRVEKLEQIVNNIQKGSIKTKDSKNDIVFEDSSSDEESDNEEEKVERLIHRKK